ncbi:hypothetical protein ACHAXT_011454 [Thalassiosira profunda]
MVEFGKTLNEVVQADWRCHAVAYIELKHALRESHSPNHPCHLTHSCGEEGPCAGVEKECGVNGVNRCVDPDATAVGDDDAHSVHTESSYCISDVQKANFFRIYEDSIRRLAIFYDERAQWAREEREKLGKVVERVMAGDDNYGNVNEGGHEGEDHSFLMHQINNFSRDLGLVLEFLDLNATAFSKIMKKFDKRTGSDLREAKIKELKAEHPYLYGGGDLKQYKKLCAEWIKQLEKIMPKGNEADKPAKPVLQRKLTLTHRNSLSLGQLEGEEFCKLVQEEEDLAARAGESENPQEFDDVPTEPKAIFGKNQETSALVRIKVPEDSKRLAHRSIVKTKDTLVLEKMIDRVSEELCLQKADSPFFDEEMDRRKPPPSFLTSEVDLGTVLGEGEFCKIYEISRFVNVRESCHICFLHRGFNAPALAKDAPGNGKHSRIPSSVNIGTIVLEPSDTEEKQNQGTQEIAPTSPVTGPSKLVSAFSFDRDANISDYDELESDHEEDEGHEHVTRGFMKDHCLRNGEARYAIKRIRSALVGEDEITDAAIDLAREAEFLAALRHPNIIRIRGTINTPGHPKYALILDRLYDTLDVQMQKWKAERKQFKGKFKGLIGKDKMMLNKLWSDRLVAAFDLARALAYLHNRGVIHRDIKPANIGFDVRGDIKIFDLGLAKELKPCDREDGQDKYRTSGLAGTRRYMAPEVAQIKPYGLSSDVYSFGVLLWEMLTLKAAFHNYSREKHYKEVIVEGKRPKLSRSWPFVIRNLLERAWHADPLERPTFQAICQLIKMGLPDGYTDASQRSDDLLVRSLRSTMGGPVLDTEHSSDDRAESVKQAASGSDSLSTSIRIKMKNPTPKSYKHLEGATVANE